MALNFPFPLDAAEPVPYTISVDQGFLTETLVKVGNYRAPTDLLDDSNANWIEGVPSEELARLAEYWASDYDWETQQEYINGNFSHFALTVPETPGWPHEVPLHYIHERNEDEEALPLLLLHGWPTTSWEFCRVIEPLTSPNSNYTGHHVVAPDLPGFGFSPAPKYSGLGPKALAGIMDALMAQLGYDRYGVVSTDLGWLVGMQMASEVPEGRITGHFSDFFISLPNDTDIARAQNGLTTEEENKYMASAQTWYDQHTGYQQVHIQQPLAIAQALGDSPVGFAGWVWHLLASAGDAYPYTLDDLINSAMLLFTQGPYNNIRYYRESFGVSTSPPFHSAPNVCEARLILFSAASRYGDGQSSSACRCVTMGNGQRGRLVP